ncbi:glycogen debranching protein GlgX [soil metagenome]
MERDQDARAPAAGAIATGARPVGIGWPAPLGATYDGSGTNFALFSDNAEGVTLCLFNEDGSVETERIDITESSDGVWHAYLADIHPGQIYGYRVRGPWAPMEGHRFNPNKLLLDPYARMLYGEIKWDDALYGYTVGPGEDADLVMDERDSAPFMPKARVVAPDVWSKSAKPRNLWRKTVIYEAHVRGLTMKHPMIPDDVRGTFAALSDQSLIDHLRKIGVTAIELMPVHAFAQDQHLLEKGLRNYWGYNTLAFFAPEPRYLATGELDEIANVVDRLHEAGIEVILDVVYNHTCEGNHLGPTLSWKGIDNLTYYRTLPGEPRFYDNLTGTGNALNTTNPRVLQMVMDSLRTWATVYGIDGFRFDLALTLGRLETGFSPQHPLFMAMLQDPVLSQCKLIAEPWDVGPGGYQLGAFPPGFSEWNGDYRDNVRDFWVGAEGRLAGFARRFAASTDLFDEGNRRPWASVNFVTAHDGFTLHDLVSYNGKHNEANGEDGRDGADDNRSWNCGVEGETDDPEVLSMRGRQMRNLLATLFLSQGVPMLLAGDELGNSQGGNNNAYCQDSEIGWIDWSNTDEGLTEFVGQIAALRSAHPALSRGAFLTGAKDKRGQPDIAWFNVNGEPMKPEWWNDPHAKCLTVRLAPVAHDEASILIMFNASHLDVEYTIPKTQTSHWQRAFDTASHSLASLEPEKKGEIIAASPCVVPDLCTEGRKLVIPCRSLVLFEAATVDQVKAAGSMLDPANTQPIVSQPLEARPAAPVGGQLS